MYKLLQPLQLMCQECDLKMLSRGGGSVNFTVLLKTRYKIVIETSLLILRRALFPQQNQIPPR